MKLLFCLLSVFLSFMAFCDVTIVKDGKASAVIVLDSKPTQSAQLGAEELRHHIKLITGADLPISSKAVPGKVNIFVGGGNVDATGELSSIAFKNGNIYLTGNDSPEYAKVKYSDYRTFPKYEYRYNGSLFAVYDFLEICCGVRFYGMYERDTVYRKRSTLTVKEINRSHTPKMDAFREVYEHKTPKSPFTRRELELWRLRWRMSTIYGKTNHNMGSIYFRYYKRAKQKYLAPVFVESHPEYFAQGYEGLGAGLGDWQLRLAYPEDKDVPPQLCYTHPGVSDWYAHEVLQYSKGRNHKGGYKNKVGTLPEDKTVLPRFKGKPFFYPIEGADNGSFCKCKACTRTRGDNNNVSALKFGLMSEIARKAGKKDPNAGVSSLAYIQSLYYPDSVDLPPNLSIQMCLTVYCWWHPVAYKLQHDMYKKWVRKEAHRRPLTVWTYLFSTYWDTRHFGKYKAFPGFYPWKTAEIIKEFNNDGLKGWFTEVQLQYNSLEAYVAARICYDPGVDTDAMIDEYFDLYYGAGGKYMKEFYREVEKAYWNPDNCPKEWLKDPNVFVGPAGKKHPFWGTGLFSPEICWQMGTDARMNKLRDLLKKAENAMKDPREKLRLEIFRKNIWEEAEQGKRDFTLLKNMPKQNTDITLPRIAEAGGDPLKVDWSKAYESLDFTDALGRPVARKSRIQLAMDSKYLYLRFHERNAAPEKGKMLWRENIEIFFSSHKSYPLYHMGISPFGETGYFIHRLVNDREQSEAYDFKEKIISRPGKNSWELFVSIPLERLPFNGDKIVTNFFRTWGAHGQFSVWSPIYLSYYIGGIQRFGSLKKNSQ